MANVGEARQETSEVRDKKVKGYNYGEEQGTVGVFGRTVRHKMSRKKNYETRIFSCRPLFPISIVVKTDYRS